MLHETVADHSAPFCRGFNYCSNPHSRDCNGVRNALESRSPQAFGAPIIKPIHSETVTLARFANFLRCCQSTSSSFILRLAPSGLSNGRLSRQARPGWHRNSRGAHPVSALPPRLQKTRFWSVCVLLRPFVLLFSSLSIFHPLLIHFSPSFL